MSGEVKRHQHSGEIRILNIKDVEREMEEGGYTLGQYSEIDSSVVKSYPCPIDNKLRTYRGYQLLVNDRRISYRAFAVCENGHAEEF